ncbi:MAG: hypothetical protein RSF81_05805 [Oscillospiraceae bacterium]
MCVLSRSAVTTNKKTYSRKRKSPSNLQARSALLSPRLASALFGFTRTSGERSFAEN